MKKTTLFALASFVMMLLFSCGDGNLPVASNVKITGQTGVGQTLAGTYTYFDVNQNEEGKSTFKWLKSTASDGEFAAIEGAVAKTYILTSADIGAYLKFEVTPVSNKNQKGNGLSSAPKGPIIANAPIATNLLTTGELKVAAELTANYSYSDVDNDAEGTSKYQWYSIHEGVSKKIDGEITNKLKVSGDLGDFYEVEVTPVDFNGVEGLPVRSRSYGPIVDSITNLVYGNQSFLEEVSATQGALSQIPFRVSLFNTKFETSLTPSLFKFENLPTGLSVGTINRLSDQQVEIQFKGQAVNHGLQDSIYNLKLIVDNQAIVGFLEDLELFPLSIIFDPYQF